MIRTNYDPNHYRFHRTDPTPWIPFTQEKKPMPRIIVALALGFLLLLLTGSRF
jgi:hypothetical protein